MSKSVIIEQPKHIEVYDPNHCPSTLIINGDGTFTHDNGHGENVTFRAGWTEFELSINGNPVARYPNGQSFEFPTPEIDTSALTCNLSQEVSQDSPGQVFVGPNPSQSTTLVSMGLTNLSNCAKYAVAKMQGSVKFLMTAGASAQVTPVVNGVFMNGIVTELDNSLGVMPMSVTIPFYFEHNLGSIAAGDSTTVTTRLMVEFANSDSADTVVVKQTKTILELR